MSLRTMALVGLLSASWAAPAAAGTPKDAQALADEIDRRVAARWTAAHVPASQRSSDAEFFRRVHLDLVGRIPRVADIRAFLAEPAPDKRQRQIETLLASPNYVRHFTNVWRAILLPDSGNQQARFLAPGFENWLRQHVRANTPYDQLAREILTLPLATDQRQQAAPNIQENPSPIAFYQATELKPENLAASTSRLFLGVKLECAQCHDHPFAQWKRKQFWEFAAFFAGIKTTGAGVFGQVSEEAERRALSIPGTERIVNARLLDGSEPKWDAKISTRQTLAGWVTRIDNPFFARAAVNRIWAHFFGIGLIEPVDEPAEQNPPSHPELLDELTRQFVAHRFDVQFLIRAITLSRTYQLSSVARLANEVDPRLFTRMAVKGLTPEQLFDSLAEATGYRENITARRFFYDAPTPREEFLGRFTTQEKRTEFQTSILQALLLMNGKFTTDAVSVNRSELLSAVIEAPFLNDPAEKIETLFLATLGRPPRADELSRLAKYVRAGGAKGDAKSALADVFWSLLNSSEFILNH